MPLPRIRILHVEDNPLDADLIRRQLARRDPDIELESVPTLAAARAALGSGEPFDLAMVDLKLPDGDGLQLLPWIQEHQLRLAVVIITGSGDQEAAIAAIKAGADDYLIKNNSGFEKLSSTLRDALRRFNSASARRAVPIRVLYAEHHAADIELTQRHLARHAPQIRMTVVHNAEQVLSRLPAEPDVPSEFDIVLLDYQLPGLDALHIAKILRQERGLDIPIVLVTGQGNESIAVQALHLGVNDFVTKHAGYLHELAPTLEKVQHQAELEKQRKHLEQLVATRTAELEVALGQARRLASEKGAFLANMSHEIRTPLNGVLGFAQIGYRESVGHDKIQSHFKQILSSGELLLGIVNDVLDFSKIDAGMLKIDQHPTDLNQLTLHLLALFREQLEAKQLRLLVKKDHTLPARILSDPLRLEQILLNLLSNAVKFTDKGHIELSFTRNEDRLVLSVSDTGIGMSETQLARIFQPFEQAESTTTHRYGGTGLGLSITSRLVELMQGTLDVRSVQGQGSVFTVHLPLLEAGDPSEQPLARDISPQAVRCRLSGMTILVAEDNEINQMVLADILESEGARVVMTCNGREALERFEQDGRTAFNLVLMDISMPEMDGHEATRLILSQAPDMPIIGQSAYAMAEERAACLASGMVSHIAKPIDVEELVQKVRQYGL